MLNLLPAIEELEHRKLEIQKLFESELNGIDRAIEILLSMNEVCPICRGKGKILRGRNLASECDCPDPNNPKDMITCPTCDGSGDQPPINIQRPGGGQEIDGFIFR